MKSVITTKFIKEGDKHYLEIPPQVLKNINALESSKVYMIDVDGILQVSTSEPFIAISMLTLDEKRHAPLKS